MYLAAIRRDQRFYDIYLSDFGVQPEKTSRILKILFFEMSY